MGAHSSRKNIDLSHSPQELPNRFSGYISVYLTWKGRCEVMRIGGGKFDSWKEFTTKSKTFLKLKKPLQKLLVLDDTHRIGDYFHIYNFDLTYAINNKKNKLHRMRKNKKSQRKSCGQTPRFRKKRNIMARNSNVDEPIQPQIDIKNYDDERYLGEEIYPSDKHVWPVARHNVIILKPIEPEMRKLCPDWKGYFEDAFPKNKGYHWDIYTSIKQDGKPLLLSHVSGSKVNLMKSKNTPKKPNGIQRKMSHTFWSKIRNSTD